MKFIITITLCFLSFSSFAAKTCNVVIFEDKGWFPAQIKEAFVQKGYQFISRNEELSLGADYYLSYVPYQTRVRNVFGKLKNKLNLYFEVDELSTKKNVIFVERSSKDKNLPKLMEKVNKKALKKIDSKIPNC